MSGDRPDRRRVRLLPGSLRTRLILLLTLALLPIGAVAVYQTMNVVGEAHRLAERDVLARTARAAGRLQAVLQRAFGAAEGLGAAAWQAGPGTEACTRAMRHFVEASQDYSYASFVGTDGDAACASSAAEIDYSRSLDWEAFAADPGPTVYVSGRDAAPGQPVLIVFVPIRDPATGALLGGQAIAVPEWLTEALLEAGLEEVALALFTQGGDILAASTGLDRSGPFRAVTLRPEVLDIPAEGRLVQGDDGQGRTHPAAIVPLIEDWIYVVGLWNGETPPRAIGFLGGSVAPVFPLLMWAASLVVAYLAVDSLVLRNLSAITRRMRRYRAGDRECLLETDEDAPREFRVLAGRFNEMMERIAEDRDRLEENVAEQRLLLREVHHRVKNNLQLIASILNMQIRGITSPEARRTLGRVQDRVMTLSTIHKALYSGERVDRVRADLLLDEIIRGVIDVGLPRPEEVDLCVALAPLALDADRTVPLSLLATEAVTNAVRHLGAAPGARPEIAVELSRTEGEEVRLSVRNTRDPGRPPRGETGGTLGSRLIEAFAAQLSGRLEVAEEAGDYRITLVFRCGRDDALPA
jgi:two-component system, sensor histidine kinase PdtaS